MIKEAIAKAMANEDLRESEMMEAMEEVMEGKATSAQIAAFITVLRMKGETVEEVTGAARIMRQKATRIDARSAIIVDTCGTGGDGMNTFNISTTTAFVVAAAGITVAKHGNRAVSSGCLPLCPSTPRSYEVRPWAAKGDRRQDDFQYIGALNKPRRSYIPAPRRL